ncbi:MAG TPA: zinc-ribbon domain-containing protein [Acetobacteraceae bacterium]|jgi:predicted Zn finger-like uncharacterized protein|nr:zinc-ribbon domain-containing protein [Acetobacteraceae bacterium]
MRIVCPACTAAYEVPTALLKPGVLVRCARCTKEWVPSAEAEENPPAPQEAAASEPAPAAMWQPVVQTERAPIERASVPRIPGAPPTARAGALRLVWVASFVVLGALLWSAYSQRVAIMQAWPPSTRVYAALGLIGEN